MADVLPNLALENLTVLRGYKAKDFTALRAYVQRIPLAAIARTYYDPNEDPHAATPGEMERHLSKMLDMLVQLAIAHGSTALAEHPARVDPSARTAEADGGDVPHGRRS